MNHEMAIRLRDDRIAAHPGLEGLPPRWKPELVRRAIGACKHFTNPKIVDPYADQVIAEFRKEHVLSGLDLTAGDADIVDTARRRASVIEDLFIRTSDNLVIEKIIATTCDHANVPEPKGDTLSIRMK